jgi:hypothetical protein
LEGINIVVVRRGVIRIEFAKAAAVHNVAYFAQVYGGEAVSQSESKYGTADRFWA